MRLHALGLTLTELLIATVMVILMMAGISAADFAMRRMDRTVSGDAQLYMRTLAMAEEIRNTAKMATGDSSNVGVYITPTTGKTMCFRIDLDAPPAAGDPPDDYSNDTWRCYTKIDTAIAGKTTSNIHTCDRTFAQGAGDCTGASRWLGPVVNNVYTCAGPCYLPRLVNIPATRENYFEFQLVSRVDPATPADVVDGVFNKTDATNPQVVMSFRVSPESHSF